MRLRAACVVVTVLVAGCAGGDEPPGPSGSPDATGTDGSMNPFAKPMEWSRGRWWTYTVTSTNPGGVMDPQLTLMVTEVQPDNYTVDTTSRSQAAFDAEMDVSYIGPITKKALAGKQQSQLVQYFQFPLEPKKEWSTSWDGVTRIIKAVGVQGDGFELEAFEAGNLRVRYSYHALAGFFGHMDFLDAQGQAMFKLDLVNFGDGYSGPYVRAAVKQLITPINIRDQPSQQTNAFAFKLDAGTSEMILRFDIRCSQAGSWELSVKPQDAGSAQTAGFQDSSPPSACTKALNQTMANPMAGDWVFDSKAVLVTGPNHMQVTLVGRTYQDLSL